MRTETMINLVTKKVVKNNIMITKKKITTEKTNIMNAKNSKIIIKNTILMKTIIMNGQY